jgi:hypothetical protein
VPGSVEHVHRPTAVRLQPAFDDPGTVRALVESAGPYWPLSSYAANPEELEALGGSSAQAFTPPWFRQDFARLGAAVVPGAEVLLANERFIGAARAIYGADAVVRPTTVYVNIMGPTPFPFAAHLDVPAFRGITRAQYPIWLLKVMKSSGLFEPWRTWIATAVSWWYEGPGGDFHYWPDGADGAARVESAPFDNVAVVADNEATFHGVAPLGRRGDPLPMHLTHESRLVRGDRGWDVVHDGSAVQHYADDAVRITMSWKADVFADIRAAELADSGDDALTLDAVVERFAADLRERGHGSRRPSEPLRDREWIGLLAATYQDHAPAFA